MQKYFFPIRNQSKWNPFDWHAFPNHSQDSSSSYWRSSISASARQSDPCLSSYKSQQTNVFFISPYWVLENTLLFIKWQKSKYVRKSCNLKFALVVCYIWDDTIVVTWLLVSFVSFCWIVSCVLDIRKSSERKEPQFKKYLHKIVL